MTKFKKLLAILVALSLAASMLSMISIADDTDSVTVIGTQTSTGRLTILSGADFTDEDLYLYVNYEYTGDTSSSYIYYEPGAICNSSWTGIVTISSYNSCGGTFIISLADIAADFEAAGYDVSDGVILNFWGSSQGYASLVSAQLVDTSSDGTDDSDDDDDGSTDPAEEDTAIWTVTKDEWSDNGNVASFSFTPSDYCDNADEIASGDNITISVTLVSDGTYFQGSIGLNAVDESVEKGYSWTTAGTIESNASSDVWTFTVDAHSDYAEVQLWWIGSSCTYVSVTDISVTVNTANDVPTTYAVTVDATENGTVTADVSEAEAGDTVTLTVTPDEGYEVSSVTATDASGNEVTVADDYTFTMPESDVTVTVSFAVTVCTHGYVSEVTTEATCTENGVITYTCSICGESYTEETEATGHSYEETVTEPTCTEGGYTTHTCSACGDTYTDSETEALGHSYTSEVVKEPTCTENGLVTYTCSRCGDTYSEETEMIAHAYGEPVTENEVVATCTEDGSYDYVIYCSACGEEISRTIVTVPATGHKYEATDSSATCTESGYTTYTCSVCGDTYTDDETEALGHDYTSEVTTEATCTEAGVMTYTCSRCGDSYTEEIPATGHTEAEAVTENEVAATCTTDGSYDSVVYCSVCGEEISRETVTVDATGHTAAEAVAENEVAATCTTDGSYDSVVYCSICGEEISRETVTVEATGHSYTSEVTTEATCTEAGVMTYTCSVCGDSYTEEIPATGHTEAEAVVENEVAATCTTDGSYDSVVYCSVCGEEISRETVAVEATGHTAGTAVRENVVEATSTTEGSYELVTYCTVCGEELSRETVIVPAKGVDIITVWLRTPANYTEVNNAIAKANALNPDDYTNFSDVTDAIDAVNWNYNALMQSYVTEMANAIETAIANLIPVSATVEDIEISEPIEPTDTETEDDGEDTTEATAEAESNPTTGIALSMLPMAVVALAAVSSKRR